jgi:hypothetical protein
MATNKKKTAKDKVEKADNKTAPSEGQPSSSQQAAGGDPTTPKAVFLSSQFTALVLVAMGISRVLEWQASARLSSTSTDETPAVASAKCLAYLGAAACAHPIIQTLLSLKFQFTLPTIATVVLFILRSWFNESNLAQINGLLVVSPIMAGMAVLLGNLNTIPYNLAKSQCVMGIVMALLANPSKNDQPFASGRVASWKSIPSMILAILAVTALGQSLLCLLDSFDVSRVVPGLLPWPEHLVVDQPAARPILQFFAVDYLLLGLLYAHGFHSFADRTQRVRTRNHRARSSCQVYKLYLAQTHTLLFRHVVVWIDSVAPIEHGQDGGSLIPAAQI